MSGQQLTQQATTAHDASADDFGRMFNRFFLELQTIFPAWQHALPNTERLNAAKRQWFLALQENRITTPELLQIGLRRARAEASDFWPSPGKFVAWCQPQPTDLGLPDVRTAYREAIDNSGRVGDMHWSHPVVYHAAMQAGLRDLAVMQDEKARAVFDFAYATTVKAVLAGESLPEIPKGIQHSQQAASKGSQEVARTWLSKMRRACGGGE